MVEPRCRHAVLAFAGLLGLVLAAPGLMLPGLVPWDPVSIDYHVSLRSPR